MKVRFSRYIIYALAGATALALTLPGVPAAAAHRPASAPHWLVADTKKHTATLTLVAGYNSAVGGFNFNGYGKGKMVISVPLNANGARCWTRVEWVKLKRASLLRALVMA